MSEITEEVKKIAEDYEESENEVKATFLGFCEFFKEKMPYLSKHDIEHRALNGVRQYYSNDDEFDTGEPFIFVCQGIATDARDVNKTLREQVLKDWSDPSKRKQLKREGKVMLMKVSDKEIDGKETTFDDVFKAVSSIKETVPLDSGEVIVKEGETWKNSGDQPIPRDFRRFLKYGKEEYENSQWSKPLVPLWKMKLFGIGYFKGAEAGKKRTIENAGVKTILSISGERADPSSPEFILRKPIMFSPVILKAIMTDNSTKLLKNVWIRKDSTIEFSGKDIRIGPIKDIINKRIYAEAQEIVQKIKEKKEGKDIPESVENLKSLYELYKNYIDKNYHYIPEIDLAEIHDYHMKYAVVRDDEGKVVKNDSGWDVTKFGEFALCNCTFKGVYENEKRGNKYVLSDYSLPKDDRAWLKYSTGLPTKIPSPSAVIVSLQTSRGNQYYDPDVEQWLEDDNKAKAFARVRGIKVMAKLEKDSIEAIRNKILKGDL